MKKHTKIYMDAIGYTDTDFIPSEISGQKAVDIHHIIGRGKGGTDRIENLMAVTREEHIEFGDKSKWMYFLLIRHYDCLHRKGVKFSNDWFDTQFKRYEDTH